MTMPFHRALLPTLVFLLAISGLPGAAQMDWSLLSSDYPRERTDSAMAYDAARGEIVLFGGNVLQCGAGNLCDTWIWDGRVWKLRSPASSPTARVGHAMAYDPVRKRILLFGGLDASYTRLNDTWEWDGVNWHRLSPATSPSPRSHHAMVCDPVRNRIVLLGGMDRMQKFFDTWEWDGSNWTQRTSSSATPSGRWQPGLAFDTERERVVLYGGYEFGRTPHTRYPTLFQDTWEWDGMNWTRIQTLRMPPMSWWSLPIVYDAARGATVLCHAGYREVWAYSTHELTLSNPLVSVATGAAVTLSIDAGPAHAGKSYRVAGCMDAPSPKGIRLGRITLPLHPDPYFWLTLQSPELVITGSAGTLDSAGKATASIRVPALPAAFAGLRFLHAFVVFQTQLEHASVPVPLTLAP